ncbi:FCD domain-containing protein [Amorphus orientalis]|uniref:DNA-binding GntR family transcriptional regulator n=1 Tax=Amorphus orientalis TaxID=649198 RepID=A0AAE4AUJ1_9HYPH|nr:FCD domain-containing protein [Amorphus orientalis]MDQ0317202.1 DNA-binding GntR family transcriptional regulator [Amorphus orientalis]
MTIADRTSGKPEGSLADRAYEAIRADILDGVFQPDQPMRLEALKDRYGYSFSPIREALTRLAADRLVTQTSLRGFRVSRISLEEMWDILRTRVLVESEAFRLAIRNGDDAWEARVVAAFHSLSKCADPGAASPPERRVFEERHFAFHRALLDGSNSPTLLHLSDLLFVQSERYRRASLRTDLSRRSVVEEHEALKDAALSRNEAEAAALLCEHYTTTGHFIEAVMASRPTLVDADG